MTPASEDLAIGVARADAVAGLLERASKVQLGAHVVDCRAEDVTLRRRLPQVTDRLVHPAGEQIDPAGVGLGAT